MCKQPSLPCCLKNWVTWLIITLTTNSTVPSSGCLFSILTSLENLPPIEKTDIDWASVSWPTGWKQSCWQVSAGNLVAYRNGKTLAPKGLLVSYGQRSQRFVESVNSQANSGRSEPEPLQTDHSHRKSKQHTGHKLIELNLKVPALPEELQTNCSHNSGLPPE